MAVFFWFLSSLLFGYSFAAMQPDIKVFLHGIFLFLILNVVDVAFIFLCLLLYLIIDVVVKKCSQLKNVAKAPKEG